MKNIFLFLICFFLCQQDLFAGTKRPRETYEGVDINDVTTESDSETDSDSDSESESESESETDSDSESESESESETGSESDELGDGQLSSDAKRAKLSSKPMISIRGYGE